MKLAGFLFCASFLVAYAQCAAVQWTRVKPYHKITFASHKSTVRSPKIVGGSDAYLNQFPWQAGIYLDGNGFCGGSLISSRVVLTAAHCAEEVRDFAIYLGVVDIESSTGTFVTSRNATMHEFYDGWTLLNDIAIIVLEEDVDREPNVKPIRLPSRSQVGESFSGQYARASGWGRTSDFDTWITQYLQFVDVKIIDNADCEAVYGDIINDSKLCVDTAGGDTSTCFGDSGGPLVIFEHEDGEPTTVGITSFIASDGCEAGFPAGFTRVSEFLDWLELHAGMTIRP